MPEQTQTSETTQDNPSVEVIDQEKSVTAEDPAQESTTEKTETPPEAPVEIPEIAKELMGETGENTNSIDLLKDVDLNVKIELGRTKMYVEDVLKVAEGSVIELDKLAGDPVDIYVNEKLVARGEVLVLNDNFCVRVNHITIDHAD